MAKGSRNIRDRGKIRLSEYFRKFKNGEKVAVVRELIKSAAYPKRIIGKSGTIIGQRGSSYIVNLNDGNKAKTFIIHPLHLKKLK